MCLCGYASLCVLVLAESYIVCVYMKVYMRTCMCWLRTMITSTFASSPNHRDLLLEGLKEKGLHHACETSKRLKTVLVVIGHVFGVFLCFLLICFFSLAINFTDKFIKMSIILSRNPTFSERVINLEDSGVFFGYLLN